MIFVWQMWLCERKEEDEITYTICLTNLVVVKEGRRWDHSHNLFDKCGCVKEGRRWDHLHNLFDKFGCVKERRRWWDHSHNLFDKFGCEFGCERRKMMRSLTQFVWQIWLWKKGRWWDHIHTLVCLFSFPISAKLSNYWLICQCVLYFPLLYLWTSQYPPPVHPHQWRMNEWMNEW